MALDPTNPRDTLIEAGRQRLVTQGIDGLRALLNASVLSREAPVSRDTAYRVFRGDAADESVADAIVAAVADACGDLAWAGAADAQAAAMEAYAANVNAGNDPTTTLLDTLRAAFEAQFRSPGLAAGWLLQAAALTGSDAWQGETPADDSVELARKVLALRRELYTDLEEQIAGFISVAVSELGRRPRRGLEARAIVRLVHSLLDGAVLRRLIDPESMPPELAAEGMLLLGLAFSEVGPADDPRKPDDERGQDLYNRVLQSAGTLWQDRSEITVDEAAAAAAVPVEAATLLFPGVGDLADSLLRARVVAGGFVDLGPFPDVARLRQHLPALASQLTRLRDLADAIPHVVGTSRAHHPTKSKAFVDDFVDSESRVIELLDATPSPEQLTRDLVTFASQGSSGWPSVVALLRTIGYSPQ
jgi:hypothetical protein